MKKYKADYVFTITEPPIRNGIVTVDNSGRILAIDKDLLAEDYDSDIETLKGIICPGFVNTHCHLELSHLRGKINPKGGLVNFIKDVQSLRNSPDEEVIEAARLADAEMYQNGIVAVGDITNSGITATVKAQSKLYYHNFIEVFGFLPQRAPEVFANALSLRNGAYKDMPASITPHAPYSVSKDLFRLIKSLDDEGTNLISIHNQESEEENKLYRYKTGAFLDLYQSFNMDISYFKAQARNSIQSVIQLLSDKQKLLLVHNTFTNLKDIYFVKRFERDITWCFCPNANLYIEDKMPKPEIFMNQGFNITVGTDSLASNQQLSVLDELRVLQKNYSYLNLDDLLRWATLNGAAFLGIDQDFGSIEVGKTPGLNLISNINDFKITANTRVERLI